MNNKKVTSDKKIILFGPYPPPYGGVAIYNYLLNESLTKFGFDCGLKIYRPGSDSDDTVQQGFKSVYKHFHVMTKRDTCLDSCTFFLEKPVGKAPFAWLVLKLFKRFRWVKVIHDGTLPTRYDYFKPSQKLSFQLLIRLVDELVVVSEDLRRWLKDKIGIKQKISVIQSLLPIIVPGDTELLLDEYESIFSRHDKIICSIGVFKADYGFRQIAGAVESARRKTGQDLGLILIDGSFSSDEAYKTEVLKSREWITVLSNLPHSQTLQVLKKCDVFIRGVALESYGLSRVEALWCGTPVIATKVGETRGMVLYDFEDQEMLAERIKDVLTNPPLEEVYSWAKRFEGEAENNLQAIIKALG